MRKNVHMAMRNTSIFERYGISRKTECTGEYFLFLVNSETVDCLRANCQDENRMMRLVFILHLARYWYSKKLGKIVERTMTSSKTERSGMFKQLRELGLLDHSGYWPGHEAAEYKLQGIAEADGAYSFRSEDASLQALLWTIYRKEMKSIEESNHWDGITVPVNWKDLVDLSEIENLDDLEHLIAGINSGIWAPNQKWTQEQRMYSVFTMLNKLVRPLLVSKNGRRFCLIDIKTSQPRLIPLVFGEMLSELLPNEYAQERYAFWLNERGVNISGINFRDAIMIDIERMRNYLNEESNDLYSDIMSVSGVDRDSAKEGVMVFLNDTKNESGRKDDERANLVRAYLRKNLPHLHLFMEYCKNIEYGMKKCAKSKGDWRYYTFSPFYRLSEIESELILEESCPAFRKMHPEANLITIHDGIMVEPEYVEAMKSILLNVYGLRGIRAVLTTEDYSGLKPKRLAETL